MPKVWDCFSYYCEKELLILRIEFLYPYVDYFVITEADMTHQAKAKSFELKKIVEQELAWAKSKIIVLELECDLDNLPKTNYPEKTDLKFGETFDTLGWRIENLQRNWSMKVIEDIDPEDIILIGDLDEFPNWRVLDYLDYITTKKETFALGQVQCLYYLDTNLKVDNEDYCWIGTVIGKRKNLQTPQGWRDIRQLTWYDENLGFHFSWLNKWLVTKFESTAHDELKEIFELEEIIQKVKRLEDPFSRQGYTIHQFDIDNNIFYPNNLKKLKESGSDLFFHKT